MALQPYRNFRFSVIIEGVEAGGFSEVSGFDATFDVVEYREGDDLPTPMKLPGLMKYGNVTMKWGTHDNTVLYEWLMEIYAGKVEVKTITINLMDEQDSIAATWQLINAWPVKYTAPDFNATSGEVAYESIEFAHEGMTRTDIGKSGANDSPAVARQG